MSFVPLSAATRRRWRALFAGQAERVRAFLEPVRAELAAFPAERIWNGWFESGDAETYYALVRALRPARIVEVGCGHSSGFAAEALRRNGGGRLTCIDPAPRIPPPAEAEHLALPWEEVDPGVFARLAPGDLLFLDSSHEAEETLRSYLLLDALPPGVVVHHHDILYPEAPRWPEENLLIPYYAFRDARWEGLAALALLRHELGADGMVELFPSAARAPWRSPGSVWLRKRAP